MMMSGESAFSCHGGINPLSAYFSPAHRGRDRRWVVLNGDLMDKIYRLYVTSSMVRTIMKRLSQEVLRGGISIREVYGDAGAGKPPPSREKTVDLGEAAENHIQTMLERAIMYGHLYGMVPVMNRHLVSDTEEETVPTLEFDNLGASLAALDIPIPTSGYFVARTQKYTETEVGWQWRDRRGGTAEPRPSKGVWVFVWGDQVPNPEAPAPFNSSIIPVFNDLMRMNDLIRMDTQAYYEMTHPAFVLQEHPRQHQSGADREMYEFATKHFVVDPEGDDMVGMGPGGTLVGTQHMLAGEDAGREVRMNRNIQAAMRSRQRSVQTRIDTTTGRVYCEDHTLLYERGAFPVPAGMNVTASYPRPTLRNDLLEHIEHTYRHIAITFGVPPIFVNSGSTDISGVRKTSSVGSANASVANNSLMHTDASAENMRKTVIAVRTELSAMYAQAHYHLVWNAERYTTSVRVARSEAEIHEADRRETQLMAQLFQLLGDDLAETFRDHQAEHLRDTEEIKRVVEIAQTATQLFQDEQVRKSTEAVLALVKGGRRIPGEMSLREVAERQQRGEGMEPVDEGLLVTPSGQDLTHPPKKRKRVDPNELAEEPRLMDDERDAHTTVPNGPQTYQRYKIDYMPPAIQDHLARATDLIEERHRLMEAAKTLEGQRAKLSPATGRRGDTKIEMVFRSLPVPNWPMLRHLVLDGILDANRYKEMVMTDLGLDPQRDGPPPNIKPLEAALAASNPAPAAPAAAASKKRKESSVPEKPKKSKDEANKKQKSNRASE